MKKMRKNSFVQGAFIATLGVVLSKILGIIYVIPFYAIIGSQGGALYGYAYNIYSLFLGISQAGIPLAISKVISEYQTLGYYKTKERAFRIGKRALTILGGICFLLLFFLAPVFAEIILGGVEGGNSPSDVAFVIRMISFAILIVPIMSVYRGYLQGHKYITPTSISQVLEQLVRVVIIIVGSFLSLKVFHQSLKTGVGIAVFAATAGALVGYFYLLEVVARHRKELKKQSSAITEPKVSDRQLLWKILAYAAPVILIDVTRSLFQLVDTFTLVKTMSNGLGYDASFAESIMSVISTWGLKLNMIVIAITTGFMVSLIPNLTASFVHKDMTDVRRKINQTLQMLFYFVLPMTIGLSLLAGPIWTIFYGAEASSAYGTVSYQYYVFVAMATTFFTATNTILQVLKEYKMMFTCLISGLLVKVLFNVPLIYGFSKMALPGYYGAITATILGFLLASIMGLIFLKKKYHVNYEDTVRRGMNCVAAVLVMTIVLALLKFVVPLTLTSRLMCVLVVMLYATIGAGIYFFITFKTKTAQMIFGEQRLNPIIKRFPFLR